MVDKARADGEEDVQSRLVDLERNFVVERCEQHGGQVKQERKGDGEGDGY